MSKKRGLSADEKVEKTKEYLMEKQEPFTLKELEKLLPKAKGVVWQSVKESLAVLQAENLVQSDKIGSNVFFWCLPSAQARELENKLEDLKTRVQEQKRRKVELQQKLPKAKEGRTESSERTARLKKFAELTEKDQQLGKELKKYQENDPEFIEKVTKYADISKEAANRWTDAVMTVRKYVRDRFNFSEEALNKEFGIPDDFDYVD